MKVSMSWKNWKESDTLEYPEKKLQILEAVRRLIGQGTDLQKLRAGDIAREAGVGKGTLYLYFDSKEIIIEETLCYMMEQRISALEKEAQNPGTFRERAIRLLKCFQQQEQSGDSALRMLLSTKGLPLLWEVGRERISNFWDRLNAIILFLTNQGIEEGIFPALPDFAYVRQAFFSAVSGAVQASCPSLGFSPEKARENALEILIRSMGPVDRKNDK